MENVKGSKTVVAALSILDCFSEEKLQIGLSELSRLTGQPKANLLRHLSVLVEYGILYKAEESKKYSLGFKTIELAYLAKKKLKLREIVIPYMIKLRDLTDETITLQVLEGNWGVCVERLDSYSSLVYLPPLGSREYLHAGASRKVLLAHLPSERIEEIIRSGLPGVVKNTVTDRKILKADLERIRLNGYALSEGEHVEGVVAISAPLRQEGNTVAGSLSIVGPAFRIENDKKHTYLKVLLEVVAEISHQLGYRNDNSS